MKIINKLFPFLARKTNANIFDNWCKLRGSKELFISLFHNATIGLYQTTPEGKILSANPSIIRMLNFDSMQDLLERDLSKGSYVNEDKRLEFKRILEEKGEIIDFESEWYTKNGEIIYVIEGARAVKNKNGKIVRYDGSVLDITDKRKAEIALEKALEKAKESDKLKSAFLANMSHEIRTPMNGILGFAGLLKEAELSGQQQQLKYIQIIEKSGARMLNIINDIVSVSKIESGTLDINLTETNINDQLQFIYESLKFDAENKNINLNFTTALIGKDAIINTDNEKLYGILSNLVKNAIKYTDTGTIEFGYSKKGTDFEFFVKDSGIGIPKDKLDVIFERFIQVDIVNKMARQGVGLGLTISRAYVEMLGGKIWTESEEDKGSTFFFTIPCNRNSERDIEFSTDIIPASEAISIAQEISGLKVLIAEDDEASEILLSTELRKFSKEILIATNGIEAVENCRQHSDIDLVLMDIQMPKMNGYKATREIRKFNKNVIIIAQTAFALTGDRDKALEAGCNNYISKPIRQDELLTLIQAYFNK